MRRLVPVVAILFTTGALFANLAPAGANLCPYFETERVVKSSDLIVIATPESKDGNVYTTTVERYLKGSGASFISVLEGVPLLAPLTDASLGRTTLLFLYDSDSTHAGNIVYAAHPCKGGTLPEGYDPLETSMVAEVVAVTGPGQPPNDAPPLIPNTGDLRIGLEPGAAPTIEPGGPNPPSEIMWLAAALIPLAFLGAAALAPRRR